MNTLEIISKWNEYAETDCSLDNGYIFNADEMDSFLNHHLTRMELKKVDLSRYNPDLPWHIQGSDGGRHVISLDDNDAIAVIRKLVDESDEPETEEIRKMMEETK